MRVTSASATTNSLAASAARRTLCEPLRSEPGMTRIFGPDIRRLFRPEPARGHAYHSTAREGSRRAAGRRSVLAIDPDARRRDVHPDAFGGFRADAVERLGDR